MTTSPDAVPRPLRDRIRPAGLLFISGCTLGGFFALAPVADAANTGPSFALNFGAENGSVTGAAGVLNTVNWNNFSGPDGGGTLTLDNLGLASPTAVSVTWSSNNTWSSTGLGEENNFAAAGNNRNLMAGYLDSLGAGGEGPLITLSGLNATGLFSGGYDIYVYIQGGVNGRGGNYQLNGGVTDFHGVNAAFDGTFIEDTDPLGTTPSNSNYLVFRNVTGDGFSLLGIPTVGDPARAGINAIEVVAVPEPGTVGLLAAATLLSLTRRRRDSRTV